MIFAFLQLESIPGLDDVVTHTSSGDSASSENNKKDEKLDFPKPNGSSASPLVENILLVRDDPRYVSWIQRWLTLHN